MSELKAMMNQRIAGMETYTEQADYIETVHDTLSLTGQLTEDAKSVINDQWDRINKEFVEHNMQKYAVAI